MEPPAVARWRAGDIYALFLKARGVPGEGSSTPRNRDPDEVGLGRGRQPPNAYLPRGPRAAKYLPQMNLILQTRISASSPITIERYAEKYRHRARRQVAIVPIVREWFQQQLIEAVLGAHLLRRSRQWTLCRTWKSCGRKELSPRS